jgi:ATP-dependent RNA helicase RhlE
VAKAMERVKIGSLTIHGDKEQKTRTEVMKKFKYGDGSFLIATDVSARGIDIPDVNYVINYDLPDKPENYVHRVGRTGRGVKKGIAVSFCSEEEKECLEKIQKLLNKEIEVIKVNKMDYKHTVDAASEESNWKPLMDDYEAWQKKKKKKKKRKKTKKVKKGKGRAR